VNIDDIKLPKSEQVAYSFEVTQQSIIYFLQKITLLVNNIPESIINKRTCLNFVTGLPKGRIVLLKFEALARRNVFRIRADY
jgi:hypothetical protein